MKTGIERLRQLKAENDKKVAAAAEQLKALKESREELETRIDSAIKDGDQVTAEKLIRSRIDTDVQIEIMQKTLVNLEQLIDRAAVAAAWADDLRDYQKQIDKGEKELAQLIRQAVEKALAIADTINASWDARCDALRLVDDEEPHTYNAGNHDFPGVSFTGKTLNDVSELLSRDEMARIRPDASGTISMATRSRTNVYFRKR